MSDQGSAEDHSGDTVGGTERRSGERYRSVWRIAMVTRQDDIGLWRIRNISSRGMMLAADVDVSIGEVLEIALSESIVVHGHIVWSKEGRCGVEFAEKIDVGGVLKTLAQEQREQGYRQPRLPFQHSAEIFVEGHPFRVQMVNISHSGVGIVFHGELNIGQPVGLMMPDQVRRTAIVRWRRGEQSGLWLTEPLPRTDLESIRRLESNVQV